MTTLESLLTSKLVSLMEKNGCNLGRNEADIKISVDFVVEAAERSFTLRPETPNDSVHGYFRGLRAQLLDALGVERMNTGDLDRIYALAAVIATERRS